MKKLVVIAMAALFTAGAYAADVAIPTSAKHKQDCHTNDTYCEHFSPADRHNTSK